MWQNNKWSRKREIDILKYFIFYNTKERKEMNGKQWTYENKAYETEDGRRYLPRAIPKHIWFKWMDEYAIYRNRILIERIKELESK